MALAIFDLDETLIHGDCATLWSEQMGRLGQRNIPARGQVP